MEPKDRQGYNMNSYKTTSDVKDDGDQEFEDEEVEEVEDCDEKIHYQVMLYRYDKLIPGKVPRQPSPLLKYLIFSNVASFIYYCRLWNGDLFEMP
jgi:hypothetical protein